MQIQSPPRRAALNFHQAMGICPLLIPKGFKALCQGGHSLTVTTTVPGPLHPHPVPPRCSQRVLERCPAKSAWGSLPAMERTLQQQLGHSGGMWAMGTAGQAPAQAGQGRLWNRMIWVENERLASSKSCHVPLDQIAPSPVNLALGTFRVGTSTASLNK